MTQCFSGNYMSVSVACPGIGKGGGGRKSERLFFCFSLFSRGGGATQKIAEKIAEKMIFLTKRVTKYRRNSLKLTLMTFFLLYNF